MTITDDDRPFDPSDHSTWPMPWALRISSGVDGAAWERGFQTALDMADHFARRGEWPEAIR